MLFSLQLASAEPQRLSLTTWPTLVLSGLSSGRRVGANLVTRAPFSEVSSFAYRCSGGALRGDCTKSELFLNYSDAFLASGRHKNHYAPRLAWFAASRLIVAPLSLDIIRLRLASSWFSRRVLLFGLASLDEALLWHFSITIKQPSAYIRFLTRELTHSDMFSHRQLLRTVVSLSNVTASTPHSGLAGITFYVSGKISVGGNSRSRHMMYFGGLRAPSRLFLEARTSCGIINTVTGCLGVNLTFYY